MRHLLSTRDMPKETILGLLDRADQHKKTPPKPNLQGKILATCFFEPSTRTRLSFETAMKRLGGDVIGFHAADHTSSKKGESLQDTIRIMAQYADAIAIRHPLEGSAALAAEVSDKPVINCGDGSNQHPTQTLLDLYTIRESQGRLEGLQIALVGDLKHGRTVHSLLHTFNHFKPRIYLIAPPGLELPKQQLDELKAHGIMFSCHQTLDSIVPKLDIIYCTRIQHERFNDKIEHAELVKPYRITPELLEPAKPNLRILHPLPRLNEIDPAVDKLSHAYYFEQSQNGLYVRQAILNTVLT